jgi:heme a synthase
MSTSSTAIYPGPSVESPAQRRWKRFARILAILVAFLTLVMVFWGGTVTTLQAGDSEPTWSFRFWEWFQPWSSFQGGHFFEMTHRQLGTVIGFLTILLAIVLWKTETRFWVRSLGLTVLALVIIQGILGGLRVLVVFDPEVQGSALKIFSTTDPYLLRIVAAMVHGALGHAIFGLLVAIVLAVSPGWFSQVYPVPAPACRSIRTFAGIAVAVVFLQLILGTYLRHAGWITLGVIAHACGALLTGLYAVLLAFAAGDLGPAVKVIRRPALFLAMMVQIQIFFGIYSYVMPTASLIRTTHQMIGSVLLAASVVLMLRAWNHLRVVNP